MMANEIIRIRNMERSLETTYKLVLKYGIENTTKEMLVRASGLSRSTLDRFFKNKADCMVQTAEWAAKRLSDRMNPVADTLRSAEHTGVELLRLYLDERRALYYEQKELFIAIAELRVFVGRNCEDCVQIFERLNVLLGFKPLLCKMLALGKADGTLLPAINEQEEAVYINGFYRELLINLALTRNIPADEEARMINGFIARMIDYYSTPDTKHWSLQSSNDIYLPRI